MGTALHPQNDEADGGRRSGNIPVHVWAEDLGVATLAPGAGQEAHKVHDELKTRWVGAEEEMR